MSGKAAKAFKALSKTALSLVLAGALAGSALAAVPADEASQVRFNCSGVSVVTLDISSMDEKEIQRIAGSQGVEGWVRAHGKLVLRVTSDSSLALAPIASIDAQEGEKLSEPMVALIRGGDSPLEDLKAHVTVLARGNGFAVFQASEAVLEYLMGKQSNHFRVEPFSGELPLAIEGARFLAPDSRSKAPVAPIKPDRKRIDGNIRKLENFKTRYTYTQGYLDSANWALEQFKSMGYKAELLAYSDNGREQFNVVASAPDASDKFYLIGGHLDSTSEQPRTLAPGADDNASGSAGVLEMAALFKGRAEVKNLRFLLFAGEEAGLKGSTAYASHLRSTGQASNCLGAVIFDMIGFDRSGGLSSMIETKPEHKEFISAFVNRAQAIDLAVKVSLRPWGSDHVPFLRLGIPTFLIIEDEFEENHNYHRTTDLADDINLGLSESIVRTVAEGLAEIMKTN